MMKISLSLYFIRRKGDKINSDSALLRSIGWELHDINTYCIWYETHLLFLWVIPVPHGFAFLKWDFSWVSPMQMQWWYRAWSVSCFPQILEIPPISRIIHPTSIFALCFPLSSPVVLFTIHLETTPRSCSLLSGCSVPRTRSISI